ncbi:DNA phosphorothioation-associated protein 4 [Nonomuraea sp. MTCD27]|uniref:DNA phosphorothioation-associated protein 4 n=1 Tax=Nonomuraea sp. MTCD27 TaxID=1676747 RepID=UPI0035C25B17
MPTHSEGNRQELTGSGRGQAAQRRLNRPKDKDDLLQQLTEQGPFQEYRDVLVFAAALGWHKDRNAPLGVRGEPIRWEVATNRRGTELLVNMIAAVESGDPEILATDRFDERLDIFERYANGGLEVLRRILAADPRPPVDVILGLVQGLCRSAAEGETIDLSSAADSLEF